MKNEIFNAVGISGVFTMLFALAELLHRKGFKTELSRKLVHLGSGILCMSFPLLFDQFQYVGLLSTGFLAILILSRKLNVLNSIHQIERKSIGAYLFPVAVMACFWMSQYLGSYIYYYAPLLTLAIADPMACLVGKKLPLKKINLTGSSKSIGGAIGFFVTSFLIAMMVLGNFANYSLTACLSFAAITTFAELIGSKGADNVTIPIASVLAIYMFYLPIINA